MKIKRYKIYLVIVIAFALQCKINAQVEPNPNILFIAINDLKPYLGCYSFSNVKTPNIDKLAQRSTLFAANYCQQAVCAFTRASLLTGLKPDKTEVWDLKTLIRDKHPNIVTMSQYFKEHGYTTAALGKIFDQRSVDKQHDKISWCVPYKKESSYQYPLQYVAPFLGQYQSAVLKKKTADATAALDEDDAKNNKKLSSTEMADVDDDAYINGISANEAIQYLQDFTKSNQPFFLAVGFHKPHLPFVAPQKYWDLYDRSKIQLATWQQAAINWPKIAYHNAGELRAFVDIVPLDSNATLLKISDDKQRELIHGYLACTSYADALVAKLLDDFKKNGLDKNTIIILWSNHGWHLGDNSLWNKHSNFEQATKAPFIIAATGQTIKYKYTNPTEFVDVFPTLCQLAGLPIRCGLDGMSLSTATIGSNKSIKDFSISQWSKNLNNTAKATMGYTLRSARYRYTEWVGKNFRSTQPFNEEDVVATELYDYEKNPDETHNLINDIAYSSIKNGLASKMHLYYKSQLQKP